MPLKPQSPFVETPSAYEAVFSSERHIHRRGFDKCLPQHQDGSITADGRHAELHKLLSNSTMRVDESNCIVGWVSKRDWIGWKLLIHQPAVFDVRVRLLGSEDRFDQKLTISLGGKTLRFTTLQLSHSVSEGSVGRIRVPNAGIYSLALLADEISADEGLCVATVKMYPLADVKEV